MCDASSHEELLMIALVIDLQPHVMHPWPLAMLFWTPSGPLLLSLSIPTYSSEEFWTVRELLFLR